MLASDLFLFIHVAALTVTGLAEIAGWFGLGRGTVAGPEELPLAEEIT